MDRSTALQLAADEMEERELRRSRIEIIDYVPSDPSQGVLAPPGSITVFVAHDGDPILQRVRDATSGPAGADVQLSREIRAMFEGRERSSYYHAYRLLRASASFATIRYGAKTLATNIFPPPGPNLLVLENPFNGGRLDPGEFTLVEHHVPGAKGSLAAIALRHMPPLTEAEKAAVEQVPESQLEMNVAVRADCCDNWTDYAQAAIAVTIAMACMAAPRPEDVSLSAEEIERLGPAASARKLLNLRRELLGHDHG
ncbi:hypothetical protein ACFYST_03480 [Kitasatospora sp. NPDC004614]|uniref:hypothetical protein n=1 Tax=unclassified Kitasatospora TaxID=2633591 RepID=UPI0036B00FE9